LTFSADNERIYSGDTSGLVVATSTRSLRAITKWQAHSEGLLGIEEMEDEVITYAVSIYSRGYYILMALLIESDSHGRDNKLHVWVRVMEFPESAKLGDTAARLDLPAPHLSYSLDLNALNYCRFSLMCLGVNAPEKNNGLIAVPGLIDSSVVSAPSKWLGA
jgi:hypothetical protein